MALACTHTFTGHTGKVRGLALVGGDRFVSGSLDGTVKLWSLREKKLLLVFKGHTGCVFGVCWIGSDKIVSASADSTLMIWSIDEQEHVGTLTGHTAGVWCVTHVGRTQVVSGSADHTLRLWDTASQSCIATMAGHTGVVRGVTMLDSGTIVSASSDKTLGVWQVPSGRCLRSFPAHDDEIFDVVAVGAGRVVTASKDTSLKLWHVATQSCVGTFTGHTAWVGTVALKGTDKLVTASGDRTVRTWDLGSRRCIDVCTTDHTAAISRVLVCLNGDVLSASNDTTIKCWAPGDPAGTPAGRHSAWLKLGTSVDLLTAAPPDLLASLIARCAPQEAPQLLNLACDPEANSMLHFAVAARNIPVVRWLAGRPEVNVDAANKASVTPARLAADRGQLDILTCLVQEFKADVDSADSNGWTALISAVSANQAAIVRELAVALHANQHLKTTRAFNGVPAGSTALDVALLRKNSRTVSLLSAPEALLQLLKSDDNPTVVEAVQLGCGQPLPTATAIYACARADLKELVSHWPVVASTPVLLQHVRKRLPSVPGEWFNLGVAIGSGHVTFTDVLNALFGSDPALQQLAVLQYRPKAWPGACTAVLTSPTRSIQSLANALLQVSGAAIAGFSTPGVQGEGVAALDRTVWQVLRICPTPATFRDQQLLESAIASGLSSTAKFLSSYVVVDWRLPLPFDKLASWSRLVAAQVVDRELTSLRRSGQVLQCTGESRADWPRWLEQFSTGRASAFDADATSSQQPERLLYAGFALLSKGPVGYPLASGVVDEYLATPGQCPSRLVLLLRSRLAAHQGRCAEAARDLKAYLLLGWHHKLTRPEGALAADFALTAADWAVLQQSGTSRDATVESKSAGAASASQDWAAYRKQMRRPCAAMDELMELVGMEEVKRQALQMFSMMQAWAELPAESRVPVTLNFVFLGNPGTGKTTVARIFGKLLHELGVRGTNTFVEKSAAALKREGGKEFVNTVNSAIGGVLFIDEAYQLEPAKDPAGRDIVDELLMAAENHREKLTIILAGYKDDIEQKLFAYNVGMSSRFEEVPFADFSDHQLRDIWDLFLRKHKWHVHEEKVSAVAVRRVARLRHTKGFGNARSVRLAFYAAIKAATTRWAGNRAATKQCIVMEDVIGLQPSRHTLPELDAALRDLEQLVGLQEVKAAVQQLIDTAANNYRREIEGQPTLQLALNRLMLGNPGTGKTTVAGIYARVLKALGLVSKGTVELRTASDFIGDVVGASAVKTNTILELCKGKVLVIDEAYNLNDNMYGKQALDTIVEKVMGAPGEDIAVLMLGYEKQMRDMLREQNPGLARRFNPDSALIFKDYDDEALGQIVMEACHKDCLGLTMPVLRCVVRVLGQQRALPNFGNAGAVRNLLSTAKTRMISRTQGAVGARLTVEDVVGQGRDASGGVADTDPLQPIRRLYASAPIVAQLDGLQKHVVVQRREGRSTASMAPGNWLFLGNPGTGKTTVAKCMGRMLHDLGVLARDHVEITSAADLTGNVVGAAKGLVADAMGRARGGVLFIDEAYELGVGAYGQEAMTKLVEMLTVDEYRTSTVVIMAGYADAMQEMLARNAGLASRFQRTLRLPDWTADDAANFVLQQMVDEQYEVGMGVRQVLLHMFSELRRRPGWANARDATSAWRDRITLERNKRVFDAPEPRPSIVVEDVQAALVDFLTSRPNGVPTRLLHAVQAIAEQQHTQQEVLATQSATRAPVHQSAARTAAAADSKDAEVAEEELLRRRRAAEEAERQEAERLAKLRAAEEAARKAAEEARRRAAEEAAAAAEALRQAQQKAAEEAEARRRAAEAAALAAQRQAAEAAREAAALEQATRVQQRLREMGLCPASFRWRDMGGGYYVCEGGSHSMHISSLGF